MCSLLYTHLLGRLEVLAVTGMGVSAAALGGVYIFVTVILATGIMSPESQKASNSPHAIIEMGLADASIMSSAVNVMPASVPAS